MTKTFMPTLIPYCLNLKRKVPMRNLKRQEPLIHEGWKFPLRIHVSGSTFTNLWSKVKWFFKYLRYCISGLYSNIFLTLLLMSSTSFSNIEFRTTSIALCYYYALQNQLMSRVQFQACLTLLSTILIMEWVMSSLQSPSYASKLVLSSRRACISTSRFLIIYR